MLIQKSEFVGIDDVVHLCAGGEAPLLKTHQEAIQRFFMDKAQGEFGRVREDETCRRCKEKVAQLMGVTPEDIALLSSSSEGINLLVHALTWKAGDNVVIADVEFPSVVLPWTWLEKQGVEVRVVRHRNWFISLKDLEMAMDDRTRVVAISLVSYFTGQRMPLEELSRLVRSTNALLVVDATHAAGVIPVQAGHADILVASCYKWLLSTHGVGIFYWNRERLPDLEPPFLGWHTGESIPDWQDPKAFKLRSDAGRFEAGNAGFIGVYILDNALDYILRIGIPRIEAHALHLGGKVWEGIQELGWELMTPHDANQRAGNICFTTPQIEGLTDWLAQRGILVWGSYAGVSRVRVSTHLYNTEEDVQRLLAALQDLPPSMKE